MTIQDQMTVLQNTKEGLVVDTIYNQNDTLFIDFSNKTTVEIPSERLEVNTYPPEKSSLEIAGLWIAIIGGIATLIASIIAIRKLFVKDILTQKRLDESQNQLKELTKLAGALEAQNDIIKEGNDNMKNYLIELSKTVTNQNAPADDRIVELERDRLRLMVKPRIWSNGGGFKGQERSINISVDNRGELCYVDDFEIIEGDQIDLYKWDQSITLDKNGHIRITGTIIGDKHPKEVQFRIRIDYHDQENYRYQSVIEWIGGTTKVIETIDLPKDE